MKRTRKKLRYISLFSGIGGFEVGIHKACPNAVCVGYSEVDKHALEVYRSHFNHPYLGSVVDISEKDIKKLVKKHDGIDLLVGGFPCQNLSRLASITGDNYGLDGVKSGLFWNMLKVINWIQKYNPRPLHIIVENNYSMSNANKKVITSILQNNISTPVVMTALNGADFGIQARKRLFWTTFTLDTSTIVCTQSWDDVLEPLARAKKLSCSPCIIDTFNKEWVYSHSSPTKTWFRLEHVGNVYKVVPTNVYTKWSNGFSVSSTKTPKSKTIITHCNYVLDFRCRAKNTCIPRKLSKDELTSLFFFPSNWIGEICSRSRTEKLMGNAVITKKIEFIVGDLLKQV